MTGLAIVDHNPRFGVGITQLFSKIKNGKWKLDNITTYLDLDIERAQANTVKIGVKLILFGLYSALSFFMPFIVDDIATIYKLHALNYKNKR